MVSNSYIGPLTFLTFLNIVLICLIYCVTYFLTSDHIYLRNESLKIKQNSAQYLVKHTDYRLPTVQSCVGMLELSARFIYIRWVAPLN